MFFNKLESLYEPQSLVDRTADGKIVNSHLPDNSLQQNTISKFTYYVLLSTKETKM